MQTIALSLFVAFLLPFYASASHGLVNRTAHRRHAQVNRLESRDGPFRATWFDTGLGACGITNSPSDFIVALNSAQYGSGQDCFKMITISMGGKSTQAQITDECPGCPFGGLDMTTGLFQFFAPLGTGVLSVDWSFSDGSGGSSSPPPPPPPPPPPSPSPKPPKKTSTPPPPPPPPTSTTHTESPSPTPTSASSTPSPTSTSHKKSSSSSSTVSSSTSTVSSSTVSSSASTIALSTSAAPTPSSRPVTPPSGNLANLGSLVVELGQMVVSGKDL